jgi:hypothetical protein
MQQLPGKSLFSESLNSKFILGQGGTESIELELVELKDGTSDATSESFALLFRGPGTFVLPQQIYTLKHSHLGEFDLFLVPVGRDANGSYYEAVFNRLRKF